MAAPPPTREQLQVFFNSIDADKSGEIDASELSRLLSAQGNVFPLSTCGIMLRTFDSRGTGKVQFSEFEALSNHILAVQWAFSASDRDRTGFIDLAELTPALRNCGLVVSPVLETILQRRLRGSSLYTDTADPTRLNFVQFVDLASYLRLARTAFGWYDADKDGTATLSLDNLLEISAVLKP